MFSTIAAPYATEPHPQPLRCPHCAGGDIRIDATLSVTLSPNDHDDPLAQTEFIAFDACWGSDAEAWCETCGWTGIVADLTFMLADED